MRKVLRACRPRVHSPRRDRAGAALLLGAVLLGGCGGDESAEATSGSSPPPATQPSEPTPETTDDGTVTPGTRSTGGDDAAVEVEIEIEDGQVTPAGEQVEASVGDEVLLEVDSDVTDELHVHSAPEEHEFAVRASEGQRFRFTVEQPGQFDVELHDSGVLVAQLVVRP